MQNRSPRIARVDRSFPWFIVASFTLAIGGGFTLAVLLPLAEALGWDWDVRWPALVQAHGHLQAIGWAGLFVIGMSLRLIPRFAGRPLRFARLTPAVLSLLVAGIVARAISQAWLDLPVMSVVLRFGTLAELAGGVLYALIVWGTLVTATGRFPLGVLFITGAVGLLAQATLGAIWLPAVAPEVPVLAPDRDRVLLALQFTMFLLPIVTAVSLRAVPVFFRQRSAGESSVRLLALLIAAGSILYAIPFSGRLGLAIQQAGALLIAAAMIGTAYQTGFWKHPAGLRPSARHVALLLRTAYIWMVLAAVLGAVGAVAAFAAGQSPPEFLVDATRHMLALGVFSTLIAGMGVLLLPVLAQRRLKAGVARAETWILWALFTSAAALRVTGALVEGLEVGSAGIWLIAVSGVFGLAAVTVLGASMLRAVISGPPEIILHQVGQL
jgi:uncharacterized protein involved in response to NO